MILNHDLQPDVISYLLVGTVSRKIFDAREQEVDTESKDHDVDKYKRRGAVQWFTRWFG